LPFDSDILKENVELLKRVEKLEMWAHGPAGEG
jgi:hypothetical protein